MAGHRPPAKNNKIILSCMRLTYRQSDSPKKQPGEKKEDVIPSFAQSSRGFIFEIVKIVLIALAVIIPIRYFLFQPFYVRGASMEPSFHDSEYLIIDEITYRFSEPQRGDVVVIRNPQNHSEFFIKRIIGLPGETLEIGDGQVVVVNTSRPRGVALKEPYLEEGMQTSGSKRVPLANDEYYVLGDNRAVSLDSRTFGPLGRKFIVGRAWLRVWPFDEFTHFTGPAYNVSL